MTHITSEAQIERDRALLTTRALQIHRGAARAAVLGVSDGLVSTLCIVLGVAAAHQEGHAVLLAGLAGLVAGAISMAAGEWISVISQVDLFRGVLTDLRRMAKTDAEILKMHIRDEFVKIGISKSESTTAATEVAKNENKLVQTYARNVIGINPEELGSPMVAAVSSFLLFTAGSIVALIPWFFIDGGSAMAVSVILTMFGGLVVGGYVSKSSGEHVAKGAIRQLLIIIFASVVTFGVGRLFGTIV